MKLRRGLVAALAVLVALVVAQAAQAVTPEKVFVEGAEGVACEALASKGNIRDCSGSTHNLGRRYARSTSTSSCRRNRPPRRPVSD